MNRTQSQVSHLIKSKLRLKSKLKLKLNKKPKLNQQNQLLKVVTQTNMPISSAMEKIDSPMMLKRPSHMVTTIMILHLMLSNIQNTRD